MVLVVCGQYLQKDFKELVYKTSLTLISHVFAQHAQIQGVKISRPIDYKKVFKELKENGKGNIKSKD